jgi:hypothetical protein
MRNLYILFEKPKEETIWETWHRWENHIRIYMEEIGYYGVNWSQLVQDRDQWRAVVDTVMNL